MIDEELLPEDAEDDLWDWEEYHGDMLYGDGDVEDDEDFDGKNLSV